MEEEEWRQGLGLGKGRRREMEEEQDGVKLLHRITMESLHSCILAVISDFSG